MVTSCWGISIQAKNNNQGNNSDRGRPLNILEIQPGTQYELTQKNVADAFKHKGNGQIHITQMPITRFIATLEEIHGKYDVIYIGNKPTTYEIRDREAKMITKPSGYTKSKGETQKRGNDAWKSNKEYYSALDLTERKSRLVQEYIESGQYIVFHASVFETDTRLKNDFERYVEDGRYPNALKGTTIQEVTQQMAKMYETLGPQVIDIDVDMKKVNQNNGVVSIPFEVVHPYVRNKPNLKEPLMHSKLYLDLNGDGLYKEEEVFEIKNSIKSYQKYAYHIKVPQNFVGQLGWKIEVYEAEGQENKLPRRGYSVGSTLIIPESESEKIAIKVLQVVPSKNTFDLKKELMEEGYFKAKLDQQKKIGLDDIYDISFEEISIQDLNKKADKTMYFSQFNMIIIGFDDCYSSNVIEQQTVAALQEYIHTGQSVMFTHDTIGHQNWVGTAVEQLRKVVGQYHKTPNEEKGYTDALLNEQHGEHMGGRSTKVVKINDGQINQYPYKLDSLINVASTHPQYYELDLEDEDVVVWYTLDGNKNDPNNAGSYYYIYSKGNVTYSGTGHSDLSNYASEQEKQLFVNTIIKAAHNANHAPTLTFVDIKETIDMYNPQTRDEDRRDAQKIPENESEVHFKIAVNDFNYFDKELFLEVGLYKDRERKDKVETYGDEHKWQGITQKGFKMAKGTDQPLTITQDILENLALDEVLYIYSKVTDAQGAFSQKMTAITRMKLPIALQQESADYGYLLGDKINVKTIVSSQWTEDDVYPIQAIQLVTKVTDNQERFLDNLNTEKGYKKQDTFLVPSDEEALINGIKANENYIWEGAYTFIPNQVGRYTCDTVIDYTLNNMPYQVAHTRDLEVRQGRIHINVTDHEGKAIEDVKIQLVRKDGESLTLDDSVKLLQGKTNAYGLYTNIDNGQNLRTGLYEVKLELPPLYQGYSIEGGDTKCFELSYLNSSQMLNFELGMSTSPVEDVSIELQVPLKEKFEKRVITNTKTVQGLEALTGKLTFKTAVDLGGLMIQLNQSEDSVLAMNLEEVYFVSQEGIKENQTNYFRIDANGKLSYEGDKGNLLKGRYEVSFSLQLPKHKTVGKTQVTVDETIEVIPLGKVAPLVMTIPKDSVELEVIHFMRIE